VPVGEAWVAWEGCTVATGPDAGRTLASIVADDPAGLLGPDGVAAADGRFPLLVKILDTADWLSLQVHPDDATAIALEGPGAVGKTESWYVLDADPGSEILLGVEPGIPAERALAAVRDGSLHMLARRVGVRAGDVVLVRAGLLHAIGPGILLYELQQPSDITYRVSDWGRPPSSARPLHPDESLASLRPGASAQPVASRLDPDDRLRAIACEKFAGDLVAVAETPASIATGGRSVHVVTVVEGVMVVESAGAAEHVGRFESVVVPASVPVYDLIPAGGPARAVVARIP
jgi:mannose-6-phosphate isomerase